MATTYTINVDYRMRTVFAILLVLSILLAYGMHGLIPDYPRLVTPAALMLFGGLFFLFDGFLWKAPLIRLLNYGIPNLAGFWEGSLSRQIDGVETQISAHLTIRQTWSKIEMILKTEEATSRNTLAGFKLDRANGILLTWVYEIDGTDPRSVTEHGRGVIELTLSRQMGARTFTGAFIESRAGEPLNLAFVRSGFKFWNPMPF